MALSDGKFLDAQAGAESFGGAIMAALAGVNSVSGPGMLDYVLVFSLEKLLFDNELCGQALHLVRELKPKEDLPTLELVQELLAEQHMITAGHTMKYWPEELYLPGPVIDRSNRENWAKSGGKTLRQRTRAEVDERLAAYEPVETDPATDAELRRIIRSGLEEDTPLPDVPPPAAPRAPSTMSRRRMRARRR